MSGIARGVHDSHGDVVHDAEQDSEGVDPEVGDRALHDIGRRTHPSEDGRCHQDPEDRQEQSGNQSECQVGMDGLPEPLVVSGPEILGDDDSGTEGQTVEESHHHEYEASGRCHAGQRLRAKGVAHNQGIGRIVQLLEQISQKERNGECDDFLPKASLREVKRACSGAHARSMSQWQEIGKEWV